MTRRYRENSKSDLIRVAQSMAAERIAATARLQEARRTVRRAVWRVAIVAGGLGLLLGAAIARLVGL